MLLMLKEVSFIVVSNIDIIIIVILTFYIEVINII